MILFEFTRTHVFRLIQLLSKRVGGVAPDSATWTASTFTSYWLQRLSCCLWRENARTIALIANQTKNSLRVGGNNQDASDDVLLASAAGFQQSNVLTNLNQNTLLTSASDDSDMSSCSPSRDSSPARTPSSRPFSYAVTPSRAQPSAHRLSLRQPSQSSASHQSRQSVSLMSSTLKTLSVTNRPTARHTPTPAAPRIQLPLSFDFAPIDRNRAVDVRGLTSAPQLGERRFVFGQSDSDSEIESELLRSLLRQRPPLTQLPSISRAGSLPTPKSILKTRPPPLSADAAVSLQVPAAAIAAVVDEMDAITDIASTSAVADVIPADVAAVEESVQESTTDVVSADMT